MELKVSEIGLLEKDSDVLVVTVRKGKPSAALEAVDRKLGGKVKELVTAGAIKDKLGETTTLFLGGELKAKRLILLGLGEDRPDSRKLRDAFADLTRSISASGVSTVAVDVSCTTDDDELEAVAEGLFLGTYRFTDYKRDGDEQDGPALAYLGYVETEDNCEVSEEPVRRAEILARATAAARNLVNEPANKLTPRAFAARAGEMADKYGLGLKIYDEQGLEELGMGALLGVARGSEEPPRVIELRYERGFAVPNLVLVGKGLTFDSGGISLKKSDGMQGMKMDMAGGAAVFAAMQAIAELKPEGINVTGLIGATENLPDGRAQKPGDVQTACNGMTVEVINTDAEGRLVVADLVAYAAEKLGATWIVDIATLTGACVVALGDQAAAVVANDDSLADAVLASGAAAAERFWRLPAFVEYEKQLQSEVADLKNVGGRKAGTITGGLFIGAFAGEKPWAHLDIAGMAWSDKDKGILAKGASGFGTRTLALLPFKIR